MTHYYNKVQHTFFMRELSHSFKRYNYKNVELRAFFRAFIYCVERYWPFFQNHIMCFFFRSVVDSVYIYFVANQLYKKVFMRDNIFCCVYKPYVISCVVVIMATKKINKKAYCSVNCNCLEKTHYVRNSVTMLTYQVNIQLLPLPTI